MKKIFTLMAVCAMALAAKAQIVSSSSRKVDIETKNFANYNRLYVSYAPMSFSGDWGDDIPTAGGVALGWLGGWSVSKTIPLYIESGLNIRYCHYSKTFDDDYYEYDQTSNFLNLSVPVNISYKYSIPGVNNLSVAPYIGLHLTGNLIGKTKIEYKHEWARKNYGDEDWSHFDSDLDEKAKRIQGGWQIGVGVNYKALYAGVGYSAEFTEYAKKVNTGGVTLSLGLNF